MQTVKGVKVIVGEVENVDREGLSQLVDSLRQKLGSGIVVLGMPDGDKVALIAGVTKDLTPKVHAGKLIQASPSWSVVREAAGPTWPRLAEKTQLP